MCAGGYFLIERIGIEGPGVDVGHRRAHLKIFITQSTHVIELVGQERKSALVGSGVYGERSQSQSLLRLCSVVFEPTSGKWIVVLDGAFQRGTPFPYFGHRFNSRGDKILGEARSGSGRCRSAGGRSRQGQDDLIPIESDGTVSEAREALDINIIVAIHLGDLR